MTIEQEQKSQTKPIKVWHFHDAPKEYKDLSDHGGDEDWLALVPQSIDPDWILWMDEGTPFGRCCVSQHKVDDGTIVIGAHA